MNSASSTLPIVDDGCSYNQVYNGGPDNYIVKFNPEATILWSSYFGGNMAEFRPPLCVDAFNNLWLAGEMFGYTQTTSLPLVDLGGLSFFDDSFNGADDSYLFKFIPNTTVSTLSLTTSTNCFQCDGMAIAELNCTPPLFLCLE